MGDYYLHLVASKIRYSCQCLQQPNISRIPVLGVHNLARPSVVFSQDKASIDTVLLSNAQDRARGARNNISREIHGSEVNAEQVRIVRFF